MWLKKSVFSWRFCNPAANLYRGLVHVECKNKNKNVTNNFIYMALKALVYKNSKTGVNLTKFSNPGTNANVDVDINI